MKKILALTVAVVMLASLATTAMAAPPPVTRDTTGVIEFTMAGIGNLPVPPGPYCPVDPDPGGPGDYTGDFAVINNFGTSFLDFGIIAVPPLGVARFSALDAQRPAGTLAPINNRVLGMSVQSYIQTHTPSTIPVVPGNWNMTLRVTPFIIAGSITGVNPLGDYTLEQFDLELVVNNATNPGPVNGQGPIAIPGGPGNAPVPAVHNLDVRSFSNASSPLNAAGHQTVFEICFVGHPGHLGTENRPMVASGRSGAVYGWQWLATLDGAQLGWNISPSASQATFTWTYNFFPD